MMNVENSTPHSAEKYDSQIRCIIPYYDSFHEEAINLIKATKIEPKRWLDTGCGTGNFAERALAAFPKTHFILVDPSEEMLLVAKEKFAHITSEKVHFMEPVSTQGLIGHKEKLDVITAIQSHHYLSHEERAKATAVCFELLSPGGIYVTFENIRPMTSEGVKIGMENLKRFQLAKGRDESTVEKQLKRFDVEYFPITIKEHISLLKTTGFSTVEMLWYSYMQAGFYSLKARAPQMA
jgi:tRNA (cmo5U34)-methyltransferase